MYWVTHLLGKNPLDLQCPTILLVQQVALSQREVFTEEICHPVEYDCI